MSQYGPEMGFKKVCYDLTFDLENGSRSLCTLYVKYEPYRAKDFSPVTFKLDQETVYKVVKQPLPKGTLKEVRVKLESRGEIVWSGQEFNLTKLVQSHCMPFTHIKHFYIWSQIELKGDYGFTCIPLSQELLTEVCFDFYLRPRNLVQGQCISKLTEDQLTKKKIIGNNSKSP